MRQEIESLPELAALSKQWMEEEDNKASRIVQRIEDIPRLEDISTGGIEWVVDGIFAQGALHMITSESGAGHVHVRCCLRNLPRYGVHVPSHIQTQGSASRC